MAGLNLAGWKPRRLTRLYGFMISSDLLPKRKLPLRLILDLAKSLNGACDSAKRFIDHFFIEKSLGKLMKLGLSRVSLSSVCLFRCLWYQLTTD